MRWILVAGCGHTGTTITAKIIGLNSHVFGVDVETHMFDPFKIEQLPKLLKSFKKQARAEGKQVICEKTPKHILHIDYARRTLKNPSFVLCTRSPYDVIASLAARERDPIDKKAINTGYRRYMADNIALLKQQSFEDSIVHKYEDFVQDPEASMRRICDHARLDFDASMLDTEANETRWFNVEGDGEAGRLKSGKTGKDHAKRRSWQVNQKIFDNRGKWKSILNDESKQHLDGLLKRPLSRWVMKRLDYAMES